MTVFLTVLVVGMLAAGVFSYMWKLSKWLVFPIQFILFALLIFAVFRVFVNRENAEKIQAEIAKAKIPELEEKVMDLATSTVSETANRSKQESVTEEPTTKPEQKLDSEHREESEQPAPVKNNREKTFLDHSNQQQSLDLLDML